MTFFWFTTCLLWQTPPELSSQQADGPVTAGYYVISWKGESENWILQESSTPDFSQANNLYEGPERARTITGKKNGLYYYRVANPQEMNWSPTLKIEVAHHPLGKAWMFFSIGAIVFILSTVFIIKGAGSEANS